MTSATALVVQCPVLQSAGKQLHMGCDYQECVYIDVCVCDQSSSVCVCVCGVQLQMGCGLRTGSYVAEFTCCVCMIYA